MSRLVEDLRRDDLDDDGIAELARCGDRLVAGPREPPRNDGDSVLGEELEGCAPRTTRAAVVELELAATGLAVRARRSHADQRSAPPTASTVSRRPVIACAIADLLERRAMNGSMSRAVWATRSPRLPAARKPARDHLDPRPVAAALLGRKHVDGGENGDRRVVGDRREGIGEDLRVLGGGARDVERVAQRAVAGSELREAGLRRLGERLERKADDLGLVGDDVAGAAGDRDDARALRAAAGRYARAARRSSRAARASRTRIDAELSQRGVDEAVVAHERAGVRERDLGGERARADLHHHDRLLELGRALGEAPEAARRRGSTRGTSRARARGRPRAPPRHVNRVDHRLVAGRDDVAEADVLRRRRTRDLAGRSHRSARRRRRRRGSGTGIMPRPRRRAIDDVDEAEAVRARGTRSSSSRHSSTSSSCTLAPCPPTSPKPDASTTARRIPAAAASASASGSPFAPTSMSARSTGSPISRQLVTAGRPCTLAAVSVHEMERAIEAELLEVRRTRRPTSPERSDAPTSAMLFGERSARSRSALGACDRSRLPPCPLRLPLLGERLRPLDVVRPRQAAASRRAASRSSASSTLTCSPSNTASFVSRTQSGEHSRISSAQRPPSASAPRAARPR